MLRALRMEGLVATEYTEPRHTLGRHPQSMPPSPVGEQGGERREKGQNLEETKPISALELAT